MYMRKSYPNLKPPANYAGVTFSVPNAQETQHKDQDTKIHKADNSPQGDLTAPFKEIDPPKKDTVNEHRADALTDVQETKEDPAFQEENVPPDREPRDQNAVNQTKGLLSEILGDKFSVEDILLFASLLLLVFGQTDDEILILAGILLLLNHA